MTQESTSSSRTQLVLNECSTWLPVLVYTHYSVSRPPSSARVGRHGEGQRTTTDGELSDPMAPTLAHPCPCHPRSCPSRPRPPTLPASNASIHFLPSPNGSNHSAGENGNARARPVPLLPVTQCTFAVRAQSVGRPSECLSHFGRSSQYAARRRQVDCSPISLVSPFAWFAFACTKQCWDMSSQL